MAEHVRLISTELLPNVRQDERNRGILFGHVVPNIESHPHVMIFVEICPLSQAPKEEEPAKNECVMDYSSEFVNNEVLNILCSILFYLFISLIRLSNFPFIFVVDFH